MNNYNFMDIEYEATFLDVNIENFREKLQKEKAIQIMPERLLKRVVFDPPKHMKGAWMRVRDEGDKITMSIKQITNDKIEGQKEVELIINNFENGKKFLKSIGAKEKAYQETKRESWKLDDVSIEIDTWPGLEPYIEIEGPNKQTVEQICKRLGLNFSQAIFGAVDVIYELKLNIPKNIINNKISKITFEDPPQKM